MQDATSGFGGGGGATNNTHTQVLLKCCHVLENAEEARCEHNGKTRPSSACLQKQ